MLYLHFENYEIMVRIQEIISEALHSAIKELYDAEIDQALLQIQKTRKEFEGDYTIVVFPLLKSSRKSPEETAREIGEHLLKNRDEISDYNVIKGFLNLKVNFSTWINILKDIRTSEKFGFKALMPELPSVMVEFSSPNTNKPLHLGHIRNNLLGDSISRILVATGRDVKKVNLVNDRGIHICKSMLAWKKFGNGETPSSAHKKGDHLVGDYYVRFDQEYKKEIQALTDKGMSREKAEENSLLMAEARELLRKWEQGDKEVWNLWGMMNEWVYEGFEETYQRMGIRFDKIYYESETYRLGKELITEGLNKGVLYRKKDGSVWANLEEEGLDNKLLLRSDGTSVYMTQDLGTAHQRFTEFNIDRHIYVVGNEQNYHFKVLAIILKKLGFDWASRIYHLSYGMVELPEGKMKSREGTVVDADDMIDEMEKTARDMSDELGKLAEISNEQKENIFRQVGLGALKYFILKVDPRKNMTFNPTESIDFNGHTGPFIQYTFARIHSVLRKLGTKIPSIPKNYQDKISGKELSLLKLVYNFPEAIEESAKELNPAVIANYLYDVAREFNQFYHDHSILNAEDKESRDFRLNLSFASGTVIQNGMYLLGIEVPERM
ncbi:MAG: arginine--tRNA ligase [Bacteroidota bacterium]